MTVPRSTREVLEDHLDNRQNGRLEDDIRDNYADDVVLLTMEGTYRGAEGVRRNAAELRSYFGGTRFKIPVRRVVDRFAYIEWRAEEAGRRTFDGADSFVVENGRIVCQTIRYTVQERKSRDDAG